MINKKKKLIYKNFLGDYNILVTESVIKKYPIDYTLVNDIEIDYAQIWIHDNILKRNRVNKLPFVQNDNISYDVLKLILGFN